MRAKCKHLLEDLVVDDALDALLGKELEQRLPRLGHLVGLVLAVSTPVHARDGHILKQDQVGGDLLGSGRVSSENERTVGRGRTFSMLPPANPTTTRRPFHAMHLSDGMIDPTGS